LDLHKRRKILKLKVSGKNEFPFYPDVELDKGQNLELPEKDRFTVVLKKLSRTIHGDEWSTYDKDGIIQSVDVVKCIEMHFVEFINEPDIEIESIGKVKKLTLKMLLSDDYPELDFLVDMILKQINEINMREEVDLKKK
jgi:hypothetical protein